MLRLAIICFILLSQAALGAPASLTIDSIQSRGSGCPAGSVGKTLASDHKSFTLIFDRYEVENNGAPTSGRWHKVSKSCSIDLTLGVPSGWSLALVSSQFRGFASLDENVRGHLSASYTHNRGPSTSMGTVKLKGDFDDDYKLVHDSYLSQLNWSSCSRSKKLSFSTRLGVYSRDRSSTGLMTVDSFDGQVSQEYQMLWRKCDRDERQYLAMCTASLLESKDHSQEPVREYTSQSLSTSRSSVAKEASASALRQCESDRYGNSKRSCQVTCQVSRVGSTSGLRLKTKQTFKHKYTRNNRPYYDWWVSLEGQDLRKVDYVEYFLHSSFGNRTWKRHNPNDGFALKADGHGGFLIKAKVFLKDGGYKWVYHRLALPPRSHKAISVSTHQSYTRRSRSPSSRRSKWYDWQVWLESSELHKVGCVKYTLHSSYDNRIKRICDRNRNFRLKGDGWGSFTVKMELELTNGQKQKLTHRLQLP